MFWGMFWKRKRLEAEIRIGKRGFSFFEILAFFCMLSLSNAEQNIQKRVDCVIKSNNGNLFKTFLCLIKERIFCDLFEKERQFNNMH